MNTVNGILKISSWGVFCQEQGDRLAFEEKKTAQEANNDVGGEIPFMEVDGDGDGDGDGDEDDNRSGASSGGSRRGEDDPEGAMSGVEDEIDDENALPIRPRVRSSKEASFSQLTARISSRELSENSSWKELSLPNSGKAPDDTQFSRSALGDQS